MERTRRLGALCASLALLTSGIAVATSDTAAAALDCPTPQAPTSGSPGLISTPEELEGLKSDSALWDEQWKLAADIDMGGCYWTDHGIGDVSTAFSGVFDGGCHTISGLTVEISTVEEDSHVGLFGYVQGTGANDGIIKNLGFTGDVSGDNYVGGLVGKIEMRGQVLDSHTTGNVTATYHHAGGLVGYISGDGQDQSLIERSSATGNVLVTDGTYAGGLIGESRNTTVTDSFATSSATATGNYVGGLIAYAYLTTVERSYSTGNVSAGKEAAGFIGSLSDGTVSDSYSLGSVTYTTTSTQYGGVAGFVGYLYHSAISNSYSIGALSGDPTVIYNGGFVGNLDDDGGQYPVTHSFWDVDTSGWPTSAAGQGETTAAMTDIATFSSWSISADFDPANTWGICPTWNSGYPFLTAFHTSNPCGVREAGRRTTSPPPAFQALPIPASGSCTDIDDTGLGWGTGITGGWSRSWQPWVRAAGSDAAAGGWACIRILDYSLGSDSWRVQSSA